MRRSEPPVRYDDSVVTLLSLAASAEGAAADAHFSNLLDLVAQNKPSTRGEVRLKIMVALHYMGQTASVKTRARAVQHVSRMPVDLPADVACLLIQITENTSRAWLNHVCLTSQAWSAILPRLPMHDVRNVAARNDLPVAISLQLVAIKPTLLLLPAPAFVAEPILPADIEESNDEALDLSAAISLPANDSEPLPEIVATTPEDDDNSQVKALLERIAWFRKRPVNEPEMEADLELREPQLEQVEALEFEPSVSTADSLFLLENPLAYISTPPELDELPEESHTTPSPPVDLAPMLADWYWETDRNGMFVFAGQNATERSLPAGTLPSLKGQYLRDWLDTSWQVQKVETALRRRTGFHQVHLYVEDGGFVGDWLLSAVAAFDPKSGVFLGHRGVAQRQLRHMKNAAIDVPDALATAAHETRTPLNAIMGFAQMIEAQPFGPVSPAYTAQAGAILDASTRLLRALDDVSESSRLDRGVTAMRDHGFNIETMIEDLLCQLQQNADRRHVRFALRAATGVPSMWSDRDIVERCVGRLAIAMLSVAGAGESISISVRDAAADHISIAFSRPARLRDIQDVDLMKPVQSTEQNQPRLNIGFALRLVERLAAVVNGRLLLGVSNIELLLPAVPSLAPNQGMATKDTAIGG
jgi:nitrogen-specific signal transduction histidine kinase